MVCVCVCMTESCGTRWDRNFCLQFCLLTLLNFKILPHILWKKLSKKKKKPETSNILKQKQVILAYFFYSLLERAVAQYLKGKGNGVLAAYPLLSVRFPEQLSPRPTLPMSVSLSPLHSFELCTCTKSNAPPSSICPLLTGTY